MATYSQSVEEALKRFIRDQRAIDPLISYGALVKNVSKRFNREFDQRYIKKLTKDRRAHGLHSRELPPHARGASENRLLDAGERHPRRTQAVGPRSHRSHKERRRDGPRGRSLRRTEWHRGYVDLHRLFVRSEMMRLCKEALASRPKTTKELALIVMAAKDLHTGDKVLARAHGE
jgi:hypothetical protein